ncbi:MAG: magnesium transporter [Dehalococcoidia bacterium]
MEEEAILAPPEIRELVQSGRMGEAAERLAAAHPADAADAIAHLDREEREQIIAVIPRGTLARIVEYLPESASKEIIEAFESQQLAAVLDEVDDDIAVDILHQMPGERAEETLRSMRRAAAIAPLLGHSDETAGGHMTRAFVSLHGGWTAERAIQYMRRVRPDADSAYYLYVVDSDGKLEGIVSLRDLIIANPDAQLGQIMSPDVVSVRDDMDQEQMARLVQRYDLVALPVVDEENRLVGVITVDDVLDVVEEEATEDIYKLAGIGVKARALSPLSESLQRRLPWLAVNGMVALVAAFVVSRFEHTIAEVAALAVFMPVIAGQGGNAGVQTSTIIVRALALEEITISDMVRVLFKEVQLGIVKGMIFGTVIGAIAFAWQQNGTFALIVASAMFLNMIVASVTGVLIPMTLRYGLKLDPATAAGVFDTMITDIMGFLIFLGLATIMLERLT